MTKIHILIIILLVAATSIKANAVNFYCAANGKIAICNDSGNPTDASNAPPEPILIVAPPVSVNPTAKKVRVPLTNDAQKQPKANTAPNSVPPTLKCPNPSTTTGGDSLNHCSYYLDSSYTLNSSNMCDLHRTYTPKDTANCEGSYNETLPVLVGAASPTAQCPAGYSGTNPCTKISDKAVPDGNQDIAATAPNTLGKGTDGDWNSADALPINQPTPDTIQMGTIDATTGQPQNVKVTMASSGAATVSVQTQKSDVNGNTYVTNNTTTFSPTGAQTSNSQSTDTGSLASGGTNGTYTPNSTGSSTPVQFPNDYAKTGEAQAAANTTNAKLDGIKDALTKTDNPADGNGTEPTFADATGNAFDALNAWGVPAHSSNCPTGTFTAFNHTFTLDAQCTVMEQVKTPLNLAAIVCWLVLALFIVLRA